MYRIHSHSEHSFFFTFPVRPKGAFITLGNSSVKNPKIGKQTTELASLAQLDRSRALAHHSQHGISVPVRSQTHKIRCRIRSLAKGACDGELGSSNTCAAVIGRLRRSPTLYQTMIPEFAEFLNMQQQLFHKPTRVPNNSFSRRSTFFVHTFPVLCLQVPYSHET